jgi:hypothetical protein
MLATSCGLIFAIWRPNEVGMGERAPHGAGHVLVGS